MRARNWGRRLNASRVEGIHLYYTCRWYLGIPLCMGHARKRCHCVFRLLIGGVGSIFGSQAARFCISAPYFASACAFDNQTSQRMQTSDTSQIPALAPFGVSRLCAIYLRLRFEYQLNARAPCATVVQPGLPLLLPIALVSELDLIAAKLIDAFHNRSQ